MRRKKLNRIVIKLGTNVVIHNNRFNTPLVNSMAKEVSTLVRQGRQFLIVSSGAIGLGLEKMHMQNNAELIHYAIQNGLAP